MNENVICVNWPKCYKTEIRGKWQNVLKRSKFEFVTLTSDLNLNKLSVDDSLEIFHKDAEDISTLLYHKIVFQAKFLTLLKGLKIGLNNAILLPTLYDVQALLSAVAAPRGGQGGPWPYQSEAWPGHGPTTF